MNSLSRTLSRIVHPPSQSARICAISQQFHSKPKTTTTPSSSSSSKAAKIDNTYTLTKSPPSPALKPSSPALKPSSPALKPSSPALKPSSPALKPSSSGKEWKRPSEIPYQKKVENSVNLIGYVDQPLQFEASPDGKYWAGTVISQLSTSPSTTLRMPIIFEGDLAHIAVCHLKKNDHIHVAGQLFMDPPPTNMGPDQVHVQVMVRSLSYVQVSSQAKKDSTQQQRQSHLEHSASLKKDEDVVLGSWGDLLKNPQNWWDYRDNKRDGLVKPNYPDFKAKDGSLSLWLSDAPKSVLSNLEVMEFDVKYSEPKQQIASIKKDGDDVCGSWRDLLENPKNWWDNRDNKRAGLVKSNYPDFKSKDGSLALWLSKVPKSVLSKLEGMEFDVKSSSLKPLKGDESWKDLVENPIKWWDNRSDKRNEKAPDFKHKETAVALWLSDCPASMLPKLPSSKAK